MIRLNLAKAELYLEQGLTRNARRILENLRLLYPDDPRILKKFEESSERPNLVEDEEIPEVVEETARKEIDIIGIPPKSRLGPSPRLRVPSPGRNEPGPPARPAPPVPRHTPPLKAKTPAASRRLRPMRNRPNRFPRLRVRLSTSNPSSRNVSTETDRTESRARARGLPRPRLPPPASPATVFRRPSQACPGEKGDPGVFRPQRISRAPGFVVRLRPSREIRRRGGPSGGATLQGHGRPDLRRTGHSARSSRRRPLRRSPCRAISISPIRSRRRSKPSRRNSTSRSRSGLRSSKRTWSKSSRNSAARSTSSSTSGITKSRYNLGLAFLEQNLYEEAIAEFELAAADPVRAADCWGLIGQCYVKKRNYPEARRCFEGAISLTAAESPEAVRPGLRAGLALRNDGRKRRRPGPVPRSARLEPEVPEHGQAHQDPRKNRLLTGPALRP